MNNLLTSIRNWNSKWINLLALAFLVLGNFINHWGFFILLISLVVTVSAIRFFHDRKWLKDAEKYIRLSEKLSLWRRIIGFVWTIGMVLFVVKYDFSRRFGEYINNETIPAMITIFISIYFSDYYQKFVGSLKSFDEGIQLPGRNQALIPWNEVYEFNFSEEDKITLSSSHGEHLFYIHKDDPGHVNAMISDWTLRNGKRH